MSNAVNADYSGVFSGQNNRVSEPPGHHSFIGGGQQNTIASAWGMLGGGFGNRVAGVGAIVGGGFRNTNQSPYSVVSGGQFNFIGTNITGAGGEFANTNFASQATIGGGQGNMVISLFGGIGSGENNKVFGDWGFIGGGIANKVGNPEGLSIATVSGTIGGGYLNSVIGRAPTVGGGEENTANTDLSTVPGGASAVTRNYGQLAYANGHIANLGDAQFSLYVLRRQTQGNSQGDLKLDGDSMNLKVPAGAVWAFRLQVTGMQVGGTNFAAYEAKGVVANLSSGTIPMNLKLRDIAGNLLPSGSTLPPIFETQLASTWQATPYVVGNGTAGELNIAVNGGAGQGAINWVATLQTTELLK